MAETIEKEEDQDLEDDELEEEDDAEAGKGKEGEGEKGKQKREPETPEARKARLDRETKRHQAKHPDLYKEQKEVKPEEKDTAEKESKLDYGQLAYLIANDIKSDDEQALALSIMKETGKELKEVVNGNYFKGELKALREDNAAKDALPGSKRAKASSPSSVEYWLEKGGLPPDNAENRDLRTKIVNARIEKSKKSNQFTDNPVVA